MERTRLKLPINALVLKVALSALIPQDQHHNLALHSFRKVSIVLRKLILLFQLAHFSVWQLLFQPALYLQIRDYKLRHDI